MTRVSIAGGSGYVAGELLRYLLQHPHVTVGQVASRSNAGRYLHQVHPHLRGHTDLRFVPPEGLEPCDALLLAERHGEAARSIGRYAALAPRVLDASADFRLRDAADYERHYGAPHPAPEWLPRFVYGLPELHRAELSTAAFASGVGCNATAVNLALLPLVRAGVLDPEQPVIADVKVGSSEGGAEPSAASHHPERQGCARSYAPAGHRHGAEVAQELRLAALHLSITAIELVRGALATCHAFTTRELAEKDLWRIYREAYAGEPFVRLVHERQGHFRHPEPKLLAGTNGAEVGFAVEPGTRRVVALAAIDNLGKGAAGSLVQCLNLMLGFGETAGLVRIGMHP